MGGRRYIGKEFPPMPLFQSQVNRESYTYVFPRVAQPVRTALRTGPDRCSQEPPNGPEAHRRNSKAGFLSFRDHPADFENSRVANSKANPTGAIDLRALEYANTPGKVNKSAGCLPSPHTTKLRIAPRAPHPVKPEDAKCAPKGAVRQAIAYVRYRRGDR
ncbi:uncharacterized protein LOC144132811 [Amblyomma americanum]